MFFIIKAHKYKCINGQVDKLDKIQMGHDAEKTLMKELNAKKAPIGDMLDMVSGDHGIKMTVYHSNVLSKYRKIIMNKNSAIKSLNSCKKKGLKARQVLAVAEEDGTFSFFTHNNFESIHWSKMKPWKPVKTPKLPKPKPVPIKPKPKPVPVKPKTVPKKIKNVEKPEEFVAPTKRVADVELTIAQVKVLQSARKHGDIQRWLKTAPNRYDINRLKGKVDIQKLSEAVDENTKLCMNHRLEKGSASYNDILKTGELKNQFQLGEHATSGGCLAPRKGGVRDKWEKLLTEGELHKNPKYKTTKDNSFLPPNVAEERPLYGYINDKKVERLGGTFGDTTFVLKNDVRKRATMTAWDSSSILDEFELDGCLMQGSGNKSMVERMIQTKPINTLKQIADGKTAPYGFTWTQQFAKRGQNYVESQIYGGVKLSRDVEMIVTTKRVKHIEDLAKKWGVKYKVLPIKESISDLKGAVAPKTKPSKWKNAKSVEAAKKQLKEQFNIGNINMNDFTEKTGLEALNRHGESWSAIKEKYPKINNYLRHKKLDINFEYNEKWGAHALNSYFPEQKDYFGHVKSKPTMNLSAFVDKAKFPKTLDFGEFVGTCGNSTEYIARHELGHHLDFMLLNEEGGSRMANKFRALYVNNRQKYFKNISFYSMAHQREGFAEAFAAYTSPLYEASKKKLPKAVEDYFKELLR